MLLILFDEVNLDFKMFLRKSEIVFYRKLVVVCQIKLFTCSTNITCVFMTLYLPSYIPHDLNGYHMVDMTSLLGIHLFIDDKCKYLLKFIDLICLNEEKNRF